MFSFKCLGEFTGECIWLGVLLKGNFIYKFDFFNIFSISYSDNILIKACFYHFRGNSRSLDPFNSIYPLSDFDAIFVIFFLNFIYIWNFGSCYLFIFWLKHNTNLLSDISGGWKSKMYLSGLKLIVSAGLVSSGNSKGESFFFSLPFPSSGGAHIPWLLAPSAIVKVSSIASSNLSLYYLSDRIV